jgi:hypothetical protein
MIGGAAYAGHRAGENQAYEEMHEQDQNARIAQLQAQQAGGTASPPPPAASPVDDLISKIKQLQSLKDQGVLTDEEFQAAKTRVISG